MSFSIFFQTFYLVFLVLISVGPVFLTTATFAMTRGFKTGGFAILGCICADVVFITIGALCAKLVIMAIPKTLLSGLLLFAGCFLLYLSYGFWKTDVLKIKKIKVQKTNFALSLKMFCLTFSSPLSIVGYSAIFTSVVDTSNFLFSSLFGGYLGSITAHSLIVLVFGTIGKKINNKILSVLNKIAAICISVFAILLFVNAVKMY